MKKILYVLALLAGTICLVVACSNDEPDTGNGNQDMEEVVPGTNHKILIAYFSQPLPNNVDAVTSASRVTVNGELYGSVQYVATIINEATGGDMVRIQTLQPYPESYDDLASQANQERQNNIHPELATNIENFDNYDVVFIGYPIWVETAAPPIRTFLTTHDLAGKTVVPFCTSGTSSAEASYRLVRSLCPQSTVLEGIQIRRGTYDTAYERVIAWLQEIGIVN